MCLRSLLHNLTCWRLINKQWCLIYSEPAEFPELPAPDVYCLTRSGLGISTTHRSIETNCLPVYDFVNENQTPMVYALMYRKSINNFFFFLFFFLIEDIHDSDFLADPEICPVGNYTIA